MAVNRQGNSVFVSVKEVQVPAQAKTDDVAAIQSQYELQNLPAFFDAIGRGYEPIAFTAYGGKGGNWHFRRNNDGSAASIKISDPILRELATHGDHARQTVGHQLGFYAGRGGSKLAQLTTVPCLKAESDQCSIADQLRVYHEFENTYGVKFTLVETGNKSVHAYLRLAESLDAKGYKAISLAFHEKLREVAEFIGIDFVADKAVAGPAQAMRLPGAIHAKTGKVACVLQLGEPTTLEQIELSKAEIKEIQKTGAKRRAYEDLCGDNHCLGYEGDRLLAILKSIAEVWQKRLPGEGTYNLVLPLVGRLTAILGAEQAAQLLWEAGHNDQTGQHSLEGLLRWCRSFSPGENSKAAIQARLIVQAKKDYGWVIPQATPSSLIIKITEETASEEEMSGKVASGGGVLVHRTGAGKTSRTLRHIRDVVDDAQVKARMEGHESQVSAIILSPRSILNLQNSRHVDGVNVSATNSEGLTYALNNVYCCCAVSIGKGSKLNGDPSLWGEFQSYGDLPGGCGKIPTGAGMPAAAFAVIDECRQFFEMILLSQSIQGEESLWRSPEHHIRVIRNVFITLENAAHGYWLDAQMGAIDQELLMKLRPGRTDTSRVIGQKTGEQADRQYAWTSSQATWKKQLLDEIGKEDRIKPIICVTACKGDPTKKTIKGLSAWDLKRLIESRGFEERTTPVKVAVVDGSIKDQPHIRQILEGKNIDYDVVITTSVAQSGFSWIDVFHDIGFLAAGETLPPNIAGGQAGRWERTLKRCVVYLPESVQCTSLPFVGSTIDEIIEELKAANAKYNILSDRHVKTLIWAQAAYAYRRINELALFRQYSLMYAEADGWRIEAIPTQNQKPKSKPPRKTEPHEKTVMEWETLSLGQQQLLLILEEKLSIEELVVCKSRWVKGGAGLDLLTENLDEVAGLLMRARLNELCDGVRRRREDELIIHCSAVLSEPQAIKILNQCGPLNIRLGRSQSARGENGDDTASKLKLIGVVVKALGGVTKRTKGNGYVYITWKLPCAK